MSEKFIADATAHALAVRTRHRGLVEDAERHIPRPGDRVTVTRWPYPVGMEGTVVGLIGGPERGTQYRVLFTANNGIERNMPASALSRTGSPKDCETGLIHHCAALIRLNAGSFLD